MPSFNCSSSLETSITLQYLPLQTACTSFSWYLSTRRTSAYLF